jgi:glutaredoxin 3
MVREATISRAMTARVVMYYTPTCPYSVRARRLLGTKSIDVEYIDVTGDAERRAWLREATGRHTVPQIFIDGLPIGGSDDLHALDARGELDRMLAGASTPQED